MTDHFTQIQIAEEAIKGNIKLANPMHIARQGHVKPLLGDRDLVSIYNSKTAEATKIKNALGFDVNITTLTQILQGVVSQEVYNMNIADFITIKTGQGAWMEELLKWRTYDLMDNDIAKGDIDNGNGKISSVDVGIDPVKIPLQKWAKQTEYNIIQVRQASATQNWDLITSLETAKRKNFDLSHQKLFALGHSLRDDIKGLYNQDGVTADTTLITKPISQMTAAELNVFVGNVVGAYFKNSNSTMKPNTFVLPTTDYLGLSNAPSADFPIGKSRMEFLVDAFKAVCGQDFRLLESAFGSQVNNDLLKNRYVLYNRDEDNLFLPLPIPYTTLLQGTADNYKFSSVSYAQYAGVSLMRPLSMLYMDYANA